MFERRYSIIVLLLLTRPIAKAYFYFRIKLKKPLTYFATPIEIRNNLGNLLYVNKSLDEDK